jgi:predicted NUDIX family NTP pyrophosphohydrolase
VSKLSAGLLVYRSTNSRLDVLLVHPGGPYWAKRDDGAWSVPKGEYESGEDPLQVAIREFREELGRDPPSDGQPVFLGEARQPSGKRVTVWAVNGDVDVRVVHSNPFTMEWPPRSGRKEEFPEVDRAAWFEQTEARRKILQGQIPFIDRLFKLLQDTSKLS